MEKFSFYQDQKVTCWERTQFTVEAENYEEALKMVERLGEDVLSYDNKRIEITDGETLYETAEAIGVTEIDDSPTLEIFDEHGNKILDNLPKCKEEEKES